MIDTERLKADAAYWDGVAPLGATHYWEPSGEWYQDCGDYALSWSFGAGKWLRAVLPLRIARPEAIPCPTKTATPEWVNGLPSVGEYCECSVVGQKFIVVEVRGFYNEMVWLSGHGVGQIVERVSDCHFRPIRTKEQKEVEALKNLIEFAVDYQRTALGDLVVKSEALAKHLLSKGYRKPEQD